MLDPLKIEEIPEPPKFRKILGPSFILLGLGLGSGELILWPYLSATYGLGIIWGALIGITLQFFINMEVERYTLATGESVFVGLARKLGKFSPLWFFFSTIIPWMWPGIISISATIFAHLFGLNDHRYIAIILLLTIGVILSLGKYLYKTQEMFQKTLILISVPFIVLLTIYLMSITDLMSLGFGLIGVGKDYWLIPKNLAFLTFLGALAYSGAGGNLNLAQSFYIKEKGFGMGKFAGKISSLLYKKTENTTLEGFTFETTPLNLSRFEKWWKLINIEHLIVFWGTGLLTMLALSLLSFSLHQTGNIPTGTKFIMNEGVLLRNINPAISIIFLITAGVTLFSTAFSLLDATSRIVSENIVILDKKRFPIENLPKYFYFILWLQIFLQTIIISLNLAEPFTLVVIGACLNAIAMFVYTGFLLFLNTNLLPKPLQPGIIRKLILIITFIFFGGFSIVTIFQNLIK